MGWLKRSFDTNLIYHIYNRGVEKRRIFKSTGDLDQLLQTIAFYKYQQPIRFSYFDRLGPGIKSDYLRYHPQTTETQKIAILAFCLMPNHFHLLIKPLRAEETSKMLSDVTNSYSKYFNKKYERVGPLFQGRFKSKEIRDNGSVINASRYLHLNPVLSSKTNPEGKKDILHRYSYSSFGDWVQTAHNPIIDKDQVDDWVKLAGGASNYRQFVESAVKSQVSLGIEKTIIEQSLD